MIAENPLLSIIVPAYRVEKYLEQCIESLLAQTYPYKEILIIDDGSPDRSGRIGDEYAKKYPCITVIHKENGGNSTALNCGMENAKGEYIAFVDADDYISNTRAFAAMVREAVQMQADIVIGNYYRDIHGRQVAAREHSFDQRTDSLSTDFRYQGFFSVGHLAYTWGKIYRLSFLRRNKLRLKHYQYAFDKLFNMECYLHKPRYGFIKDYVYTYRYNEQSVSHRYISDFSGLWMEISEVIYKKIIRGGYDRAYLELPAYTVLFAVFFCCKQEYVHSNLRLSCIVQELKKFRAEPLVRHICGGVMWGRYLSFRGGYHWKLFLWGLSLGLNLKMYHVLSFGIKLLIDHRIDGRLSSIGKAVRLMDKHSTK